MPAQSPPDNELEGVPRHRNYNMSYGMAWYKFQMHRKISDLERKKKQRKEQFGLEYLKLAAKKGTTTNTKAKEVFRDAMYDILSYNNEIKQCQASIEERTMQDVDRKKRSTTSSRKKPADIQPSAEDNTRNPGTTKSKKKKSSGSTKEEKVASTKNHDPPREETAEDRGRRGREGRVGRGERGHRGSDQGSPMGTSSPGKLPKQISNREVFQQRHSPPGKRTRLSAANLALVPDNFKEGSQIKKWTHSVWRLKEYHTNGGWSTATKGLVEKITQKSIQGGIQNFKDHPQLFVAIMYVNEMLSWPEEEQEYTLIYRDGTTGLKPKGVKKNKGPVTLLVYEYLPLPSLPNDLLPKKYRDKYTDDMTHMGKKLITKNCPAFLPGRGTGLMDDPALKLMGSNGVIDPSDIAQGSVGDCWLLSGIAALAEFDGAIGRLFRNTKDLHQLPYVDGRPNKYTATLWDLKTWTEVDVTVDERLPARKDPPGVLFGAKATLDGELWVAYLEKAIAAHCGGWDAIEGGQCTHAWSLLTGCREQYIIQRASDQSKEDGTFGIWAKYDTEANQWCEHGNSPHEGQLGLSRVDWPALGGGGSGDMSEDSLFERMCIWNENNYLIGASSKGESDKNTTNGVVDNHAYSVIDCQHDVAGTGISMARVRNPWGYGGIENGLFARGGQGWKKYPEVQKALKYKELEQDDGVFWVTKKEFFHHYHAIYLGAIDMHKFLGISPIPKATESSNPVVTKLPLAPDMDSNSESDSEDRNKEDDIISSAVNIQGIAAATVESLETHVLADRVSEENNINIEKEITVESSVISQASGKKVDDGVHEMEMINEKENSDTLALGPASQEDSEDENQVTDAKDLVISTLNPTMDKEEDLASAGAPKNEDTDSSFSASFQMDGDDESEAGSWSSSVLFADIPQANLQTEETIVMEQPVPASWSGEDDAVSASADEKGSDGHIEPMPQESDSGSALDEEGSSHADASSDDHSGPLGSEKEIEEGVAKGEDHWIAASSVPGLEVGEQDKTVPHQGSDAGGGMDDNFSAAAAVTGSSPQVHAVETFEKEVAEAGYPCVEFDSSSVVSKEGKDVVVSPLVHKDESAASSHDNDDDDNDDDDNDNDGETATLETEREVHGDEVGWEEGRSAGSPESELDDDDQFKTVPHHDNDAVGGLEGATSAGAVVEDSWSKEKLERDVPEAASPSGEDDDRPTASEENSDVDVVHLLAYKCESCSPEIDYSSSAVALNGDKVASPGGEDNWSVIAEEENGENARMNSIAREDVLDFKPAKVASSSWVPSTNEDSRPLQIEEETEKEEPLPERNWSSSSPEEETDPEGQVNLGTGLGEEASLPAASASDDDKSTERQMEVKDTKKPSSGKVDRPSVSAQDHKEDENQVKAAEINVLPKLDDNDSSFSVSFQVDEESDDESEASSWSSADDPHDSVLVEKVPMLDNTSESRVESRAVINIDSKIFEKKSTNASSFDTADAVVEGSRKVENWSTDGSTLDTADGIEYRKVENWSTDGSTLDTADGVVEESKKVENWSTDGSTLDTADGVVEESREVENWSTDASTLDTADAVVEESKKIENGSTDASTLDAADAVMEESKKVENWSTDAFSFGDDIDDSSGA